MKQQFKVFSIVACCLAMSLSSYSLHAEESEMKYESASDFNQDPYQLKDLNIYKPQEDLRLDPVLVGVEYEVKKYKKKEKDFPIEADCSSSKHECISIKTKAKYTNPHKPDQEITKTLSESVYELDKENLDSKNTSKKWRFLLFKGYFVEEKLIRMLEGQLLNSPEHEGVGIQGIQVHYTIAENVRGWPIDILIGGGISQYLEGDNPSFVGETLSISFVYKFKLFGKRMEVYASEGLSYTSKVPYWEEENVKPQSEGRSSHLLNYMAFGIGINVGDLFGSKSMNNCYAIIHLDHRSGIFGAVPIFNKVSGGSNYQTYGMMCKF